LKIIIIHLNNQFVKIWTSNINKKIVFIYFQYFKTAGGKMYKEPFITLSNYLNEKKYLLKKKQTNV